jgi:hypothetical protein
MATTRTAGTGVAGARTAATLGVFDGVDAAARAIERLRGAACVASGVLAARGTTWACVARG